MSSIIDRVFTHFLVFFNGVLLGALFITLFTTCIPPDPPLPLTDQKLMCLDEVQRMIRRNNTSKDNQLNSELSQLALDMIEQQRVFINQEASRQKLLRETESLIDMHFALVNEVECPNMVRLGQVSDGGKWVCNPWRLQKKNDCIIYSLGAGLDPSFERQFHSINPNCHIFTFDPDINNAINYANWNIDEDVDKEKTKEKSIHFIPWKISAETNFEESEVTLLRIFSILGHATSGIDILKMDIEGSEHDVMPIVFKTASGRNERPLFCQLLIEIHALDDAYDVNRARKMIDFLQIVSDSDYLLFSKEINLHCGDGCAVEMSFIHKNCTRDFGVTDLLSRNFMPKIELNPKMDKI